MIETLYQEHYKRLLAYVTSSVQNRDRAQDIVQDVFHEALRRIDTVTLHENPGGWLMVTAKNKVLEDRRQRTRDLRYFLSLSEELSEDAHPTDIKEPDEEPAAEKIKRVLSPEEFQLLRRFAFEGASHLDIAKEFGITVYASQKRLERIRKKLYEFFPERKNLKK